MASSNNNSFVLVLVLVFAFVIEDCAAQTCEAVGTVCLSGNSDSCCSGSCEFDDGGNGRCACSEGGNPCASTADCCSDEQNLACSNNNRCVPCVDEGEECNRASTCCESNQICLREIAASVYLPVVLDQTGKCRESLF